MSDRELELPSAAPSVIPAMSWVGPGPGELAAGTATKASVSRARNASPERLPGSASPGSWSWIMNRLTFSDRVKLTLYEVKIQFAKQ